MKPPSGWRSPTTRVPTPAASVPRSVARVIQITIEDDDPPASAPEVCRPRFRLRGKYFASRRLHSLSLMKRARDSLWRTSPAPVGGCSRAAQRQASIARRSPHFFTSRFIGRRGVRSGVGETGRQRSGFLHRLRAPGRIVSQPRDPPVLPRCYPVCLRRSGRAPCASYDFRSRNKHRERTGRTGIVMGACVDACRCLPRPCKVRSLPSPRNHPASRRVRITGAGWSQCPTIEQESARLVRARWAAANRVLRFLAFRARGQRMASLRERLTSPQNPTLQHAPMLPSPERGGRKPCEAHCSM